MIQRNYYCLIAGFPDLIHDDKKLPYSSVELYNYLEEELHPEDFKLVRLFYLPFDHDNLLHIIYEQELNWNDRGNYSREILEQFADKKQYELMDTSDFPPYMVDFIETYFEDEKELTKTNAIKYLTEGWYKWLRKSGNDFVMRFADYKQNLGNILLALNGRKHDFHYENAIIGDNDIANALKKSRSRDFGLSSEVDDIENIIQIFETNNILDREMQIDSHMWKFLDELSFFDYFTIEKVLTLVQKIFMAERWFNLDKEKGQQIFNQLLVELQSNFEFPEEFAITYGKRK